MLSKNPCATKCEDIFKLVYATHTRRGAIDVMEIFGGKAGVCQISVRKGLSSGGNWDLTTGINLSSKSEVQMLIDFVHKHAPKVLVMGPPCTAFGCWSRLNAIKAPESHAKSLATGLPLALLAARLAQIQLSCKRHFVLENPRDSKLWELPQYQQLARHNLVVMATCDQCAYGLTDPDGYPTMKPTTFMCSSPVFPKRLGLRCPKTHKHVHIEGLARGIPRSKYAQTWPVKLCEAIVAGILELKHAEAYVMQCAYPEVFSSLLCAVQ